MITSFLSNGNIIFAVNKQKKDSSWFYIYGVNYETFCSERRDKD